MSDFCYLERGKIYTLISANIDSVLFYLHIFSFKKIIIYKTKTCLDF